VDRDPRCAPIEILGSTEAVRLRPGLWLDGTTARQRLENLVLRLAEAALLPENRARRIRVVYFKTDNALGILDDGAGQPVEPVDWRGCMHPQIELACLLEGHGLRLNERGSLWGVGNLVAGVSEVLRVFTRRPSGVYALETRRAALSVPVHREDRLSYVFGKFGTLLSFRLDPSVLAAQIDASSLEEKLGALALTHTDVQLTLSIREDASWHEGVMIQDPLAFQ
jgi:DNA gyrase/topoisomerase IV subunit B